MYIKTTFISSRRKSRRLVGIFKLANWDTGKSHNCKDYNGNHYGNHWLRRVLKLIVARWLLINQVSNLRAPANHRATWKYQFKISHFSVRPGMSGVFWFWKTYRLLASWETIDDTFPCCWYAIFRSTRFILFYQIVFYSQQVASKVYTCK